MLQIDARTHYLVLHDVPGSQKRRISLKQSLEQSVDGWTAGSRVSPCWPLKGSEASRTPFLGKQTLLFLGPIQPAELFTSIEGLGKSTTVGVWFTAGCFNVVLRCSEQDASLVRSTENWLKRNHCAFERWKLSDGVIEKTSYSGIHQSQGDPAINDLAKRIAKNGNDFLQPALQENVIAISTALKRAASVHTATHQDLRIVAEAMNSTLEAHSQEQISTLDLQSRMLSMNAAMSRFSSQAFSGVPPILATECHFWVHSLLGTGSANLALSNLVRSVQNVLGESRLAERLQALSNLENDVPDNTALVLDSDILKFDVLTETEREDLGASPIVPLVTYFSGRDGFSSQLQTLSAPLSTLAECNSFRSNILTATHEISHIFIQAALSVIAPSLDKPAELNEASRIAGPKFLATNHLEAARKLVVEAVLNMENADSGRSPAQTELQNFLSKAFDKWRKEMQEILVHAFDFMYFHQSQPEFYVTSIWHSWCSIPGISDRVPEYLLRTLCAISADILDSEPSKIFDAALRSAEDLLVKVDAKIDPQNDYVKTALQRIENIKGDADLKEKTRKEFSARMYLVRLARIYLFSPRVAGMLFDDHSVRSGAAISNKKKLRYDTNHIGNALNFLRKQLKHRPSEAESLWVLHCLAFDLYQPEEGLT